MSTASAIYCSAWIGSGAKDHWYLAVNLQDVTFNPDNKTSVGVLPFSRPTSYTAILFQSLFTCLWSWSRFSKDLSS